MKTWAEKTEVTDLRSKIIEVVRKERAESSSILKRAYALSAFFLMKETKLSKNEVLAGNIRYMNIADRCPGNETELQYMYSDGFQTEDVLALINMGMFTRAPGGHVIPAYDVMIQEGIEQRLVLIRDYYKRNGQSEKKDFYQAELLVLDSFQKMILRYAESARQEYEKDADGRENMRRIYEACQWIAYHPARSFFEAVQLLWFAHEGVVNESGSGSISFGRIDQYLFPYYQQDIDNGTLTPKEAQRILIALWRKIALYEKGWQNITIGGSDENGKDMCNVLTIMCMQASLIVHADQPQLSLRVHENMPQNVWDKAFELIRTGRGIPELYNDPVTVKAKMNVGVSEKDAWNYGIVGCVEPTIGGKEYSYAEGARINWAKLLELMLNDGVCQETGLRWRLSEKHSLDEFVTFNAFYDWYKREMIHFTEYICKYIIMASDSYSIYWPTPFLDSMMQGCIESGKDAADCGTIYNNLTINCVGIASIADSLEAVEKLVFCDKRIKLGELPVILNHNFEGCEEIRKEMLLCSKYGNHIDSVDKKVQELIEVFTDVLEKEHLEDRKGKRYIQAGFYTSYFHAEFGEQTGATPDGRYRGQALSSSLSPTAGMDKNGPLDVIHSANKINMERFGNGMVLDLKFIPSFFEKQTHMKGLQSLIEEYFANGGMEIQFNVIDKETLLAAQIDPEMYADLIVRVSGFSGYFIKLEKSLQDEIIRRIEHQI